MDAADVALFRRAERRPDSVVDVPLRALTHAADHSVLWWAVAAVLAVRGGPRGRRAAVRGALAIGLASGTVNQPLKRTVRRPRPPYAEVPLARRARELPTTTSFPSGHAASAAAFATAVSREIPVLAAPLGVAALGVGWSRVHSGVHHPLDVAVGLLLGALASRLADPLATAAMRAIRQEKRVEALNALAEVDLLDRLDAWL